MKIKNWSKLTGERMDISGASLVFTSAIEKNNIYYVGIIDAVTLESIFDLSLKELNNNEMDLSITANGNHFGAGLNGIKRVMRKSDLRNLKAFVITISKEISNNRLFEIYLQLIYTIQTTKRPNTKATPVNPLNFNQPNSSSIQW